MTSFFQLPFHQQHHQRMEFIFHNSYTILDLVPSTVIFWQNLLMQGYVPPRLKSSLEICHCRHHELVDRYEISRSQIKMDLFPFTQIFFFPLTPTIHLPDTTVEQLNSHPFLSSPGQCYPLKPLGQVNLQLLGGIYGRSSIKNPHFVTIRKHQLLNSCFCSSSRFIFILI